jgi:signal transduction histidine kinase
LPGSSDESPRVKAIRVLLWSAAVGVGLTAESMFYGFRNPTRWLPDLVAGWTLIGCGLVGWRRRPESRVGVLLLAAGFCWFLGNFSRSDVAAVAWIARHGVYLHRGPLVHAVVAYPTGRTRSRTTVAAVVVGYSVAAVEPLWADERLSIVLGLLFVGLAVQLHARSVARERRARLTAVWVAAEIGLVVVGGAAARLVFTVDVAENALRLAYETALCGAALALVGGVMSRSWDRVAVADLVVELGEERSDRLREGLARALSDPSLEVGYWSPETERYVDSSGRPVSLPTTRSDRATTSIEGANGAIGVLIHHPSVLDDPGLAESIATATRLGSVNARLQAEVRAQISELEASRRRIVTVGDEEHRRLERRLREGAEHRLENLASLLDMARRRADTEATSEPLGKVAGQLTEALEELRALAAGLHPRLLTEAGLGGALDALAARSATAVQVAVSGGRLPAALEAAVYFVCSEALTNIDKHAAAASVTVAVSVLDRVVRVEVSDDGVGGADPAAGTGLVNLIDRVQAFGGTLDIASPPLLGTRLVAELPFGGNPSA